MRPERSSRTVSTRAFRRAYALTAGAVIFCAWCKAVYAGGPIAGSDISLSGVYTSAAGASITLVQPTNSAPWILMTNQRGVPSTLFLGGDASALQPIAMERALPLRGEPVDFIVADGRIYGRAAGQGLEILMSDAGVLTTALGGKPGSGESSIEIEARMIVESFAAQWEQVRGAKVVVSDGVLKLTAPVMASRPETVETVFTLSHDLSLEERDRIAARDQVRVRQSEVARSFQAKVGGAGN